MTNNERSLKFWRFMNNLTQAEVAKCIKCNQATYSQYENGKTGIPHQAFTRLIELIKITEFKLKEEDLNPKFRRVKKERKKNDPM
jgi:transcriptional regulator with XRE-family HTH domain